MTLRKLYNSSSLATSMKESKIKKLVEEGWIRTKMVFEIAGMPEAHVAKTMKDVMDKFEKEDIKVINITIHSTRSMGEKVFSTFSEAEFLTPRVSNLFGYVYDYMPSSVEILEPDNLTETTANVSDIINDAVAKLHQYDNAFKKLYTTNVMLKNQLAGAGKKTKDSKPKKK